MTFITLGESSPKIEDMVGNKLHFALIGSGAMGTRWASVISSQTGCVLSLIVDNDLSKAMNLCSKFKNCRASNVLDDVLKDPQIDSVLVAVPHKYLYGISMKCLKSGKNVLCEKPGAVKSYQIKRNIDLALSKKCVYMIGFNHRFHQGFIKARKIYDKKTIGDLIFIRARYGFGGRKGYGKEWRLAKEISGGGELIDQGVHMIDLAISYMGSPDKAVGFAESTFWKSGSDDNAFVLLKRGKTVSSIHVSLTHWNALHNFEIYGTKGYISIEGLGRKYGGTEVVKLGLRPNDFKSLVKEKVYVCDPNAEKSLKLELDEFIKSIKEKRKPIPDPDVAFETLKVVEEVYSNQK